MALSSPYVTAEGGTKVEHETFFRASMTPANGARLAPPRPDYRWREIASSASDSMSFFEEERHVDQRIEIFPTPHVPPHAEPPAPPQTYEPEPPYEPELPHSTGSPHMKKILDVLRMYEADWKLAKFASSEEKTYAVLLPRDSKLSIE